MGQVPEVEELKQIAQSIKEIGLRIEIKSAQSDDQITQILRNSKMMCDQYLNKPFEDSFNI